MIKPSDHPDFIGGIVWSECEIRWIEKRLEEVHGQVIEELFQDIVTALGDKEITIKRNGKSIKAEFIAALTECKELRKQAEL